MKPCVSLHDLAWRLGFPLQRLEAIASDVRPHYKEWTLKDKRNPAKSAQVRSPRPELKQIQRSIVRTLLAPSDLSEIVHGGVKDRSPRSNAEKHLGKSCVVTLDVREFYKHVRHSVVYRLLRKELGFGREVARLLTRLTTYRDELPRGAPTSLAVANLLLRVPLDLPLTVLARRINVDCTRFVDDIALSGDNPRQLINEVAKMLSRRGLKMYRERTKYNVKKPKLKIMPRGKRQEVTGLLVDRAGGVGISRQRRDRIRAAISQLTDCTADRRRREIESIRARIRHVAQFNQNAALRLERQLDLTVRNCG